jgi:hypothetical protein
LGIVGSLHSLRWFGKQSAHAQHRGLPQYSPGPRAGATAVQSAEVGIVKFDRPPPTAHPTPQSGSGQAGSDCARPGKTGLRVAEGPGQRLRVSGDLKLRVPGLLPKSRRAQATSLASSRSAGLGPPAGSLPFFRPRKSTSLILNFRPGAPGPRGTEVCLCVLFRFLLTMPRVDASV